MRHLAACPSYNFGSFADNHSELVRLKQQAEVGLTLERRLWRGLGLKKGMRVLDAGSGSGAISCQLARWVFPGEVIGVELNADLIKVSLEHQERLRLKNLTFRRADLRDLPTDLGTFDFVYTRFVLQHLDDPINAVKGLFGLVRPGGVLCALDVDDGLLLLYPEPPQLKSLLHNAAAGQRANGGDRTIGRKLFHYFKLAGVERVTQSAISLSSSELGLDRFIDLTLGYRHELMASSPKRRWQAELQDIRKAANKSKSWGMLGVIWCAGRRET